MHRAILIVCFIFYSLTASAQTIRQLEDSLRGTVYNDTSSIQRIGWQILNLDPYNEVAISRLSESYFEYGRKPSGRYQQDSLDNLFGKIIAKEPADPRGYFMRAEYGRATLSYLDRDSVKLSWLEKAIKVDSDFIPANYELGLFFYTRFVTGMQATIYGCIDSLEYGNAVNKGELYVKKYIERVKKAEHESKKLAPINGPSAIRYLKKVWLKDTALRPVLHRALLQLATYLPDSLLFTEINKYHEVISTDHIGVPIDSPKRYFAIDLLTDTTYSMFAFIGPTFHNYLILANSAKFKQEWYSRPLANFQEPLINNEIIGKESYRFTWIGSFHPPAVFRLEHSKHTRTLIYKTYVYKKRRFRKDAFVYINRRRRITSKQYEKFLYLLNQSRFFQLPTFQEVMGLDGARWLLEGKSGNTYHLVDRWSTGGPIEAPCRYLINLSGRTVRKKKFY